MSASDPPSRSDGEPWPSRAERAWARGFEEYVAKMPAGSWGPGALKRCISWGERRFLNADGTPYTGELG